MLECDTACAVFLNMSHLIDVMFKIALAQ